MLQKFYNEIWGFLRHPHPPRLDDGCLRLRKLGLSILVLPTHMCVHFWYFGLWIWHAVSESESSWNCLVFDDRLQLIEWQKDHWALKERGMNVMIKRLTWGGPSSGGMTIWHFPDVTMHSSNAFFKTYLIQTSRAAAASHMPLTWF